MTNLEISNALSRSQCKTCPFIHNVEKMSGPKRSINPVTPMSDQDRISPYDINTISTSQVMRIKKTIDLGIISWSNTKFS